MYISYDYTEFLEEFEEEIADGMLKLSDIIYIQREEKPLFGTYRPIIDWYYPDDAPSYTEPISLDFVIKEMESLN